MRCRAIWFTFRISDPKGEGIERKPKCRVLRDNLEEAPPLPPVCFRSVTSFLSRIDASRIRSHWDQWPSQALNRLAPFSFQMSHLYGLFNKQVARFCADSSRPDCNKNLLVTGIRSLATMNDNVLDTLDPYQRGAKEMSKEAFLSKRYFLFARLRTSRKRFLCLSNKYTN